jgi:hypothetical protein
MPSNFSLKRLQLKRGDTVTRVWGSLMVVCWKDKQEILILILNSNMHIPPVEHNFKEGGKAVKSLIIEDYTTRMSYVDFSDRRATALARKPGSGWENFSSICWT